jgi:hypothetical protein
MSSKASGARRATLTSRRKGAAAPTRWWPPRTRPATNGARSSAGRIWSMCRRWADDDGLAPHGTEGSTTMSRQNRVPLADRVAKAAKAALAARHFVSAIDILVGIGWLDLGTVERWRCGADRLPGGSCPGQSTAYLGSHAAIPVLGDRERIVRKPDGVCRSYAAAPDAALQPKRKSCDRGVIPDTLGVAGAFGEEARAGGAFFRERPRQHELGLEHRAGAPDHAVQPRRHPTFYWMEHPPLHLGDDLAGIALIPVPVELLGDGAELDNEVSREILGLDFAAFLPPEPEQGVPVVAHDDPGVRAADEAAPVRIRFCPAIRFLAFLRGCSGAGSVARLGSRAGILGRRRYDPTRRADRGHDLHDRSERSRRSSGTGSSRR